MPKANAKHLDYIDPITSTLPGDDIVLENGQTIFLEAGDPPGAILSLGDGSTVTVERRASIESERDGDVGILSQGAASNIGIDGLIRLDGNGSVGASIRDGEIRLGGSIEMGGNGANGLVLNAPTATAVIERGGSIDLTGDGSAGLFAFRSGDIAIHGDIDTSGAYSTGVFAGDNTVTNTGEIRSTGDGSTGIQSIGATRIENSGTIAAEGEAAPATFGNEGSAAGIFLNWAGAEVVNSGRISSDHDAGIVVDPGAGLSVFGFPPPPAGATNTIVNEAHGRIEGEVGIRGSDYIEIVENAGRIEGGIDFGGGDDIYQAVGNGRTDGVIDGGAGNDVLIADHGRDTLLGGDGDDWLDGGKSRDVLDGGAGDDVLTGGQGRDTFIYSGGNDVITDFSAADELELVAFDLAAAQVSVVGDDLVYRWSAEDSLTIEGGADAHGPDFAPEQVADDLWIA